MEPFRAKPLPVILLASHVPDATARYYVFEANDTCCLFDERKAGVADTIAAPRALIHSRAPLLKATGFARSCSIPLVVHAEALC